MKHTLTLLLLFLLHTSATGRRHCGSITTYWGQNGGEFSLKQTCATGRFGHVNIAFIFKFGGGQIPAFDLSGHCEPPLNNCAFLSEQIEYCQSLNVKVLLSIGGAIGNYTLTSDEDARQLSDYLWNNFLRGNSAARPLGAAVLDGVDLAISQGSPEHYPALVKYLRSNDKKILISAAPFCPFPSKYLGRVLASTRFDYISVQFSKNPECEYSNGSSGSKNLLESWRTWTRSKSVKSAKIYLGLMAADGFASGYIPAKVVRKEIIPVIRKSSKYGGVMLWSEYWDEWNHNYSAAIFDSVTECTK